MTNIEKNLFNMGLVCSANRNEHCGPECPHYFNKCSIHINKLPYEWTINDIRDIALFIEGIYDISKGGKVND